MRKYLLLIVSIALSAYSSSQTTLTYQNHAFLAGDNHDFYLAKTADEGKAGANLTWDFSALMPTGSLTSHMLTATSTEKGALVGDANIALVEGPNTFYFKVTRAGMEQFGSATGNSVSTFSQPFMKMKYPFSYGDVASGNYVVKMGTPEKPMDYTGGYKIEADAYGTLILPNGVYKNTLRVKQTRTFNANDAGNKEITYRWYTSSVRYPLMVIIKYENQGISTVAKVAYYAHSGNDNQLVSAVSNDYLAAGHGLEVYPNPVTDNMVVNYRLEANSKVSIDLYDATGSLVTNLLSPVTKEAGHYSENFNLSSNLPSAYYYVKATIGNQTLVKKIVKMQ